jgi:predicted nucleic acid-binding Zn ribbon protein
VRSDRAVLAELLERALPPSVRRRVYSLALVEKRWEKVVGLEIARRSEPEALEDGVLTVRVTDPAWGKMILKLQKQIVPALNQAVGKGLVRRINFVRRDKLQKPASEALAAEVAVALGPPPESVMRASDAISDDELREAVRKSASLYLRAREERRRK